MERFWGSFSGVFFMSLLDFKIDPLLSDCSFLRCSALLPDFLRLLLNVPTNCE